MDNPPDKDLNERPKKTTGEDDARSCRGTSAGEEFESGYRQPQPGINGVRSDSDRVFNTLTDDASLGANGMPDGKA